MSSLLRCGRLMVQMMPLTQTGAAATASQVAVRRMLPESAASWPTFCAASRTSLSTKRWPRGMTNAPALFLVDSCGGHRGRN